MAVEERRKKIEVLGMVFLFLFLALFPFLKSGYWVRVLTSTFMFAIIAESINLLAGYTGYVPFGNVVFFGVGAYTTGVLMTKVNFPFLTSLVIGGAMCALYSVLLGLPILRLRGHYFAVATVGVNKATEQIVINLSSLTGGGMGMSLPLMPGDVATTYKYFYFFMLGLLLVCMATIGLISRSRLGYALRAVKDDEEAASVTGINTTKYKIIAWWISAAFTGLAGGIYAYWMTYLEAANVFDIAIAVKGIVIMLLGGAGTVFGPLIGAFVIELISESVWGYFLKFHLGVLGLIMIIVVIFLPRGFMDLVKRKLTFSEFLANIREGRV